MLNNSLRESYIDNSPFLLGNSVSGLMLSIFQLKWLIRQQVHMIICHTLHLEI